MSLPYCCVSALEAGEHLAHSLVRERRPPEPPAELDMDALFDLPPEPKQGGQHP